MRCHEREIECSIFQRSSRHQQHECQNGKEPSAKSAPVKISKSSEVSITYSALHVKLCDARNLRLVATHEREGGIARVAQNSRDSLNASVDCVRAGENT